MVPCETMSTKSGPGTLGPGPVLNAHAFPIPIGKVCASCQTNIQFICVRTINVAASLVPRPDRAWVRGYVAAYPEGTNVWLVKLALHHIAISSLCSTQEGKRSSWSKQVLEKTACDLCLIAVDHSLIATHCYSSCLALHFRV